MAITTGKVRLSYCHVWQPQAPQAGGEPKYSVTILIPKNDVNTLNAIYAEMEQVKQAGITSSWGGTLPPIVKIPLYDGDGVRPSGEPFGPECKGHMVITASSKTQPQIVDINVQPILNQADVYSGCYGRVNINFFSYSNSGNKGLGCGLNCIQKIADGEPLAGGVSAQEAFGGSNAYTGAPGAGNPAGIPQMPGQTAAVPYGMPPVAAGYGQQVPVMPVAPMTQAGIPAAAQQGVYQQPGAVDPITGRPAITGGVMGL